MDPIEFPPDFAEFLRSLNANGVDQIIRMGVAPIRIGILTGIDGVEFDDCAPRAIAYRVGDEQVPVIGLDDLKANKAASGRNKDLDDLEHLP